MTQEEKQKLAIALCEYLPYGVQGALENGLNGKLISVIPSINSIDVRLSDKTDVCTDIIQFKPYLRPMSSMTEAEKKVYDTLSRMDDEYLQPYDSSHLVDWLNRNKFDYRGLIPMGLAIEAPNEMYNN